MSNNTLSECYLSSCGPDKAFCHTLDGTHKTQLSINTLYELCASHIQYCITLLIHPNFNPCINQTSFMDMPIPIGTFHSMYLTTETYATYTHICSIMICKKTSILSTYISVFLQNLIKLKPFHQ
jgi:hypothetical protein